MKEDEDASGDGICFRCKKRVSEEFYCYGCKEHVCSICDETMIFGEHTKEQHIDNGDTYEW